MTGTQFAIALISAVMLISLTFDGYKRYILKKKAVKRNYWFLLLFPLLYYILFWDANYFNIQEQSNREKNDIPPIEKTMQLNYRTRFKEVWKNNDTLKIKHASKIIRLGQSIEKETDYFTNETEKKTLRIKTTFPLFSSNHKKEYALLNGIIDHPSFEPRHQITIINEQQKDSVLIAWKLNKQQGTIEAGAFPLKN